MKMQTGCRPVRIYLAMEDGALPRAITQVFGLVGEINSQSLVDNHADADLVLAHSIRNIEDGYDVEKTYGLIGFLRTDVPKWLPDNIHTIGLASTLVELANLIQRVWLTLKPLEAKVTEPITPEVPLLPDALRILVIEDTHKHRVSARAGLAGHKLTVVTGYVEAMKILSNEKFEVVLTDLQMPMSSRTLSNEAFKIGQLVPYGIMLMIEAAHRGAKHVAVVTDLNHHADWMSAAFDHFRYPIQIDGAKAKMMHSPMNGDGTKDWASALDRLMKD